MTVKRELEGVWCNFINSMIDYPCILESLESSEFGFPIGKVSVDEINFKSEGILPSRTIKNDDFLTEKYKYNAEYMLTLNFYYKSDKEFNVDNLIYTISNYKVFSREIENFLENSITFKKIALRGGLDIENVDEYLQGQTVSRYRYQQSFIVEVTREYDIEVAKQEKLQEVELR